MKTTSALLLGLLLTTVTQAQIQIVDSAPSSNQIAISDTYTQNFDSLTGTGAGRLWTNNYTLSGWYGTEEGYGLGFGVGSGIYSMGYTGGQGDRALGEVGGFNRTELFAVRFQNLTSFTLTGISVSFDGEQWSRRSATHQTTSSLLFAYRIFDAGTGAIYFDDDTGWTYNSVLNFTSPNAVLSTGSNLDGNAPENSVRDIQAFIDGLILAPGQELWLSWGSYSVPLGIPIHGLGIDNIAVSFTAVPEPASAATFAALAALGVAARRRRSARIPLETADKTPGRR